MKNSEIINKFLFSCESQQLGESRIKKYYYILNKISKMLNKDFDKANKDDITKLLVDIQRKPLKEWTKHDYRITIKKFYKWLGKEELVSWFKTTVDKNKLPLPTTITREELLKLIQSCRTVRDKALISVLYESGCRIGELINVRLNEIEFDAYGSVLIINRGKTGSRRIRICGKAVEYLKEWVNVNHPTKKPDDVLFPYTYEGLAKVLKNIGKRAGLNKRIHFHMFRHGRATELSKELSDQELKIFMGWSKSSNMTETYVHLSGKDIEQKILQISGISEKDKIDNALNILQVKKPEVFDVLYEFVKKQLSENK